VRAARVAHQCDCSGFAKAAPVAVGAELAGQADEIVDTLRAGGKWTKLTDRVAAEAREGAFVLAGPKSGEQAVANRNSHVVVVVDGALAFGTYPPAFWGGLGGTPGHDQTLNFAWEKHDRDRISYTALGSG
jgi:hypothetical protein